MCRKCYVYYVGCSLTVCLRFVTQVHVKFFTFRHCACAEHWNSNVFAEKISINFDTGNVKSKEGFSSGVEKLFVTKSV